MKQVRHLGLIPDGGRRWGRTHGVSLLESYLLSMTKLEDYVDTFYARGVASISLYLLSRWNLSRGADELDAVFEAEGRFLEGAVARIAKDRHVGVKVAGNLAHLPDPFRLRVEAAVRGLPDTGPRRLFLCIAYDPFEELFAAFKTGPPARTHEEVLRRLWVDQDIDLVIRTGGGQTLSHFLPLQAGYARLVLLDELFNDTTIESVWKHVSDHETMELQYGS